MISQTTYSTAEAIKVFEEALPFDLMALKTVLHLNAGNKFGGIERMSIAFAKWQSTASIVKHHFGVCFDGFFWEKLCQIGAACYPLGASSFWNLLSVINSRMALKKLLRQLSPDVVVCHGDWVYRLFSKVVAKEKIKLVRMLHSIPIGLSSYSELNAEKIKPDLIIANSEITKATYLKYFTGSLVKTVYPPCPVADPSARGILRKKTRIRMMVRESKKVILSAARFERSKGHSILVKALSALPLDLDWECWIAGIYQDLMEKKYFCELKKECLDLGIKQKIKWLGHVDDMDSLYAGADVYCQPNIGPESFGMTFVEAQNMGCPIITTAFGGALESVEKKHPNVLLDVPSSENVLCAIYNLLSERED